MFCILIGPFGCSVICFSFWFSFWFILRRAHLEHSTEVWWSHRYFYVRWLCPGAGTRTFMCPPRHRIMWLNFLAQGKFLPPAGIELGTFGLQRPWVSHVSHWSDCWLDWWSDYWSNCWLLTWSCLVTSNRQLGHHEVSTVVSSLHHPGCCCIQESRGDPEYCWVSDQVFVWSYKQNNLWCHK